MNLTGIQIFKYLPAAKKTENANCKKCTCPTCMAFALKLAQKKIDIGKCPYVPQELLDLFSDFLKKQQNTITLGTDKKIGGETVMFRHEKTFVNKTTFAVRLFSDDLKFDEKLNEIASYEVERVGEKFKIDAVYLEDKGGNLDECIEKINKKGLGLIVKTQRYDKKYDSLNPIVESENTDSKANVVVSGNSVLDFEKKVLDVKKENENIVLNLDIQNKNIKTVIEELTQIRRLGIINRDEAYAHPVMVKLFNEKDVFSAAAKGAFLICRYANIIVFDELNKALLTTLCTLRQGIYTDPQKPLQVEAKVYEICEPNPENAFVILTTNFALTYFAVANELESASIPSYLIIAPADGMSVLTAWSADKFNVEVALKAIKAANLEDKVKHKEIIIPGLLADMREELQEEVKDWKIVTGTCEAIKMPEFIEEMRRKRNAK